MNRRTALALATSVALSVAGATFAVGTTLGLFGVAHSSGPTGQLSPVADDEPDQQDEQRVRTIYVDVTESPEPGRAAPPAASVPASPPQTVEETVVVEEPAASPSFSDDDHEDDGADDHAEDEHEEDDGGEEVDD